MTRLDGAVLAFPGQGVERGAVLAVLEQHRGNGRLARLAEEVRGEVLARDTFDDPARAQVAVYLASVAQAEPLTADHVAAVVGHSLGEFAALTIAGALTLEDGAALVAQRAVLCRDADRGVRGGMVAAMHLDAPRLEWLRRRAIAATRGVLEVAAVNGRRQVVLSGTPEAIDHLLAHIADLGGIGQRLPIAGGYHSPLMAPAADILAPVLDAVEVQRPQIPWLSTIELAWHEEPDDIRRALLRALILPVRWIEAMELITAAGASSIVDVGPGETLHKLGRRAGWPMRSASRVATGPGKASMP